LKWGHTHAHIDLPFSCKEGTLGWKVAAQVQKYCVSCTVPIILFRKTVSFSEVSSQNLGHLWKGSTFESRIFHWRAATCRPTYTYTSA